MGVKGYAIHLSFSPGNGVLMRDNTPKSTRTQGGDPIADYIRADTRLPAYLPYPRFLLKMEISQTAKLLYSLLLDRSTLSQKNKWLDDEGRIYIIYPIAEIAEILDKGSTTIKGALNELDTAGLLERERGGFSAPNRLYVKVPPVPQVQFSDQLMAGSPPLIEPENRPTDGQKTDLIYGLLGRNGAGKTTTMRMLLGLTAPTSGEVTIFGKHFQGNEKKILPRIGCLIESPGFYPNLTGTENLKIFATLRGLKNPKYIKNALELVNLPYRDKKLFSQYSLGMKQRLAIALAVMHNPELLILDEPINGLDPIGIAEVRDFIRELCDASGKTILISSHILSEISLLADDVGIIDHGKLLEEESLKELEAKNAKFIHFCVSDAQKAAQIITTTFSSKDIRLADANNLYLYNTTLPVAKINRSFIEAGIDIQEAHLCEDTLEDYFKKITGGEGIA